MDAAGNAYVTGVSGSTDFPILNPLANVPNQTRGAFVAKYDPNGHKLYASALGIATVGSAITVDGKGTVYVAGAVTDSSLPALGGIQAANAGATDAFVLKIAEPTEPTEPTVQITMPANGAVFQGGDSIQVEATVMAAANPIAQMELYVGCAALITNAGNALSYSWTNAPAGSWVLTTVARGINGVAMMNSVVIKVRGTNGFAGFSSYQIETIDLGAAYHPTLFYGLNDAGHVVGTRRFAYMFSPSEGFLWASGSLIIPDGPCFFGINDAGTILGATERSPYPPPTNYVSLDSVHVNFGWFEGLPPLTPFYPARINSRLTVAASPILSGAAYVWKAGQPPTAISLGAVSFVPGLNDLDRAVGYYLDTNNLQHPFLWENGAVTDLDQRFVAGSATDSWTLSTALDINHAGQIVGTGIHFTGLTDTKGAVRAYLLDSNRVADLGAFHPVRINRNGQVVGTSAAGNPQTASPDDRAYLWQAGALVDVNMLFRFGQLTTLLNAAVDINDRGQILCQSGWIGYLLTPQNSGVSTNSAALRLSHTIAAPGQFQMQVEMAMAGTYVIQTSTDLKTWSSAFTNTVPAGVSVFTDKTSPNAGDRLYRAVLQP